MIEYISNPPAAHGALSLLGTYSLIYLSTRNNIGELAQFLDNLVIQLMNLVMSRNRGIPPFFHFSSFHKFHSLVRCSSSSVKKVVTIFTDRNYQNH